ncbi:MAG: Crp/Fnr family transcriptional regulator [Candidatus Manganitrophaceae bacterium]
MMTINGSGKMMATDCNHCVVRVLSAFCGELNPQEIDLFMKMKRRHVYEKGDAIFYEGNSCAGIYILCFGSVKLVQSSKTGKQQILNVVSPGELIEKSLLFHAGRHSATAQALERSEASFFYRDEFLEALKSNNHLAINLIKVLSQEVENIQERTRQLLFKSAKERLADTLLTLGKKHGEKQDRDILIDLDLKREELAEMIGVEPETVVRLLALLKKEKLIRFDGRKIFIIDEQKLTHLCG